MCKASIAAVVLALGIVSLVQEGTNAMVALPASAELQDIEWAGISQRVSNRLPKPVPALLGASARGRAARLGIDG